MHIQEYQTYSCDICILLDIKSNLYLLGWNSLSYSTNNNIQIIVPQLNPPKPTIREHYLTDKKNP